MGIPTDEMERELAELAEERRYCRNAATALMILAYIKPEDCGLVHFLGNGTERTNAEAVYTWVNRNLRVVREVERSGSDPLDYLYAELLRTLPEDVVMRY